MPSARQHVGRRCSSVLTVNMPVPVSMRASGVRASFVTPGLTCRALPPVAYRSDKSSTVAVPLDYCKCLGVQHSTSQEDVRRAFKRRLQSPPDVNYSEYALFSRAVLLRHAAEQLLSSDHKQHQHGHTVNVGRDTLPPTLVLLQESGESQLVIDLGQQWLEDSPDDPLADDVAAAVALAHCDKAAEALQQDSSVVSEACQHLEAALRGLRQHQIAPQLQQQIIQALEDFSPRYCLELLALPLDQVSKQARQRGLVLLRQLAFELPQEVSPIGNDRETFLDSARRQMTSQEHLALDRLVSTRASGSLQHKLNTARALVVTGYEQLSVATMQRAAIMYQSLAREAKGADYDLRVERAACALLLGNASEALQLLSLPGDGDTGAAEADDAVRAYVLEHSGSDGSDLLAGAYALTQSWLQEEAMGGFRTPADEQMQVELGLWFSSKQVQWQILAARIMCIANPLTAWQAVATALAWLCSLLIGWAQQIGSWDRKQRAQPTAPQTVSTARSCAARKQQQPPDGHFVEQETHVKTHSEDGAASAAPHGLPEIHTAGAADAVHSGYHLALGQEQPNPAAQQLPQAASLSCDAASDAKLKTLGSAQPSKEEKRAAIARMRWKQRLEADPQPGKHTGTPAGLNTPSHPTRDVADDDLVSAVPRPVAETQVELEALERRMWDPKPGTRSLWKQLANRWHVVLLAMAAAVYVLMRNRAASASNCSLLQPQYGRDTHNMCTVELQ